MQYPASLITADGAYHCPVGSIMAIFFIVASLSILSQLFQSAYLTMSAMDLDFYSEVEAQMVEWMEVIGDSDAIFKLERICLFQFIRKSILPLLPLFF